MLFLGLNKNQQNRSFKLLLIFAIALPGQTMRFLIILFNLIWLLGDTPPATFREQQQKHTRVREAYKTKETSVIKTLGEQALRRDSLRIYLRAFKTEKKLELWGRNICDSTYRLIKEIPICEMSGDIGPKRRSYDLQVPEGFYYINELNPYSKYYLSMKINYPNASDSIRGVKGRLGNLIYIHGACESSGCIAISDEKIKELFVYCIEAYNAGQKKIGITIYPARLEDKTYNRLIAGYSKNKDKVSLWGDLKKSYDLFNQKHVPPTVKFLPDGTHEISISPEIEEQTSDPAVPVAIQGPTLNQ